MKTIRYKQEFKGKHYMVYVEMTKGVFLSVYLAEYLFKSSMKSDYPLKQFYAQQGRPTQHCKDNVLPFLKVVDIVELDAVNESLFSY